MKIESRPNFNVVNRGTFLHIGIDINKVVPNNNGRINFKIFPKEIKKEIIDQFADLIPLETLITKK